jgi:hypothetical protein
MGWSEDDKKIQRFEITCHSVLNFMDRIDCS